MVHIFIWHHEAWAMKWCLRYPPQLVFDAIWLLGSLLLQKFIFVHFFYLFTTFLFIHLFFIHFFVFIHSFFTFSFTFLCLFAILFVFCLKINSEKKTNKIVNRQRKVKKEWINTKKWIKNKWINKKVVNK